MTQTEIFYCAQAVLQPKAVTLMLDGKIDKARSLAELSKSCMDMSSLMYTVGENGRCLVCENTWQVKKRWLNRHSIRRKNAQTFLKKKWRQAEQIVRGGSYETSVFPRPGLRLSGSCQPAESQTNQKLNQNCEFQRRNFEMQRNMPSEKEFSELLAKADEKFPLLKRQLRSRSPVWTDRHKVCEELFGCGGNCSFIDLEDDQERSQQPTASLVS